MKTNKGFSLVELIVVIAIMAIIAAVAVPVYNTYITKADDSVGLDKIDGIVYAVKLANIEFFTETTAEFDGDDTTNKTVTVSFFGTNKNLAALRVGEILNVTAENDNVTVTLNKSLTDTAHEKAVAKLAEINTYEADVPDNNGDVNDNNDGGMVDNVQQDPSVYVPVAEPVENIIDELALAVQGVFNSEILEDDIDNWYARIYVTTSAATINVSYFYETEYYDVVISEIVGAIPGSEYDNSADCINVAINPTNMDIEFYTVIVTAYGIEEA